MNPTFLYYFQFKFLNNILTIDDIKSLDNYICNVAEQTFSSLQISPKFSVQCNFTVFFLHYLLNRLQHFRNTFFRYTFRKLRYNIQPRQLNFEDLVCLCNHCNFPNLRFNLQSENINAYFSNLLNLDSQFQKIALSVIENCFEIQCLHIMFLQKEFPNVDYNIIEKFVYSHKINKN